MTTQVHFTQINTQQEVAQRVQSIASELDELREIGELHIEITASDLFYLEALGFIVDFTTGLVIRPDSQATTMPTPEGIMQ